MDDVRKRSFSYAAFTIDDRVLMICSPEIDPA
jgi:hypothetical protein